MLGEDLGLDGHGGSRIPDRPRSFFRVGRIQRRQCLDVVVVRAIYSLLLRRRAADHFQAVTLVSSIVVALQGAGAGERTAEEGRLRTHAGQADPEGSSQEELLNPSVIVIQAPRERRDSHSERRAARQDRWSTRHPLSPPIAEPISSRHRCTMARQTLSHLTVPALDLARDA